MQHRSPSPRRSLAAALAVSFLMMGCTPQIITPMAGTAEAPATTSQAQAVLGRAVLDHPLAGATVRLLATDGRPLEGASGKTDERGYFRLGPVTAGVKDFRVEITEGTRNGTPSGVTLKADVRGFDPVTTRVYANAVTTLAAARLDLEPTLTAAEAEQQVRQYLSIPASVSLGIDLEAPSSRTFSHTRFMREAERQGGADTYLAGLAKDIKAGAAPTRAFASTVLTAEPAAGGMFSSLAKKYALKIGEGIVSRLAGEATGRALAAIFETPEEKRQKEIMTALDGLKQQLQGLDQHVAVVGQKVDEIRLGLRALEQRLTKDFGLLAYNTSIAPLYRELGTIEAFHDRYMDVIGRYDGSPESRKDAESLADDIARQVPSALETIHLSLVGAAGGTGAIRQWHTVVANKNADGEDGNRFPYVVNATFVAQLNDQYEYFEAMQVRGLNLMIEERLLRNDTDTAKKYYKRIMENLAAQQNLVYSPRLTGSPALQVLFSPKANLMWTRGPVTIEPIFQFEKPQTINPVNTFAWGTKLAAIQKKELSELRTGGFTDWRLPSPQELEQLGAADPQRTGKALQEAGFDLSAVLAELFASKPFIGVISNVDIDHTKPATGQTFAGLGLWNGRSVRLPHETSSHALFNHYAIVLAVRSYKPYPSGIATP